MSIEFKVCKKCGEVVTEGYPCPNCATDNYGTQPTDNQHGQEAISRCECYDNGNKPCLVVDRRFSDTCAVCGKQLP